MITPAPIFTFFPILLSPIYDKWLIFESFLIYVFFISTKFPIWLLGPIVVPGLNLAKGPIIALFKRHGFQNIRVIPAGETMIPFTEGLDLNAHENSSLYLEANC